jgi:hypothetical protein
MRAAYVAASVCLAGLLATCSRDNRAADFKQCSP